VGDERLRIGWHLRTDHLREHDGQTHLAIGSPPLLIPPKLAAILR